MKRNYLRLLGATMVLASAPAFADSPGPSANPYRAYPPSCLAVPLPAAAGPTTSTTVSVSTVDSSFQVVGSETVNFMFWRTPCSNGKSALLGVMFRDQALQSTMPAPVFPGILGTQGSEQNVSLRLAQEPNTYISGIPAGGLVVSQSQTFVFENTSDYQFDFSQSLDITVPGIINVSTTIPAYDPTQYSDATLALPITGYLTGNWFDPSHSGEGVQTEIGESPGTPGRFIGFAWYTYNNTGTPYWLIGSGNFAPGDRSATITLAYETGGGFAGSFGASASATAWGRVTVSFPDCGTMAFNYASDAFLPTGVPQGSGSKQWTRLTSINGLTCE
jgi:hypothetical protein